MSKWTFTITDTNRPYLCRVVADAVIKAPVGYLFMICAARKSRPQENYYHKLIDDIAKQCKFMGRPWDADSWKRLLIEGFVQVKREEAIAGGQPDPFERTGQIVPSLDGMRLVQLGVQSRGFSPAMASEFIEYLFAYGAENNVTWSQRSMPRLAHSTKQERPAA